MEPAHVGLILDSSVVIAGERRGHTVRQILEQFKGGHGEIEVGLSVVTIVELTHGVQRVLPRRVPAPSRCAVWRRIRSQAPIADT